MNLKKILRPLYHWSTLIFKINFLKTIYINFRTQSFLIAIKLPIIVYGKLKIYSLRGNIIIKEPISIGMIHIGKDLDHNPVSLNPIKMTIIGDLIFEGHALISGGSTITCWSGEIIIGKNVCLGSGVQLKAVSRISIGDYSRIIALCVVMDTNVHYVKNIETGVINRSYGSISIGKNCWINSGSIVGKGTIIPDYCISARNSFLNKDYSKNNSTHTLFAGSPAKPIATNVQRIFDFEEEQRLNMYFADNLGVGQCIEDRGVFSEPEEISNLLKLF